jgi:lysophospholipase
MNSEQKQGKLLQIFSKEFSLYTQNNFADINSPKAQLLCVHGLGTYSGWFDELAQTLKNNQISTFSFDLLGFGNSGKKGEINSFEDWLETVKVTWQDLNENYTNQNNFLLGHSLGGIIALNALPYLNPKPKALILTVPAFMANSQLWSFTDFMFPTLVKAFKNDKTKIKFPAPKEVHEALINGKFQKNFLTEEAEPKMFLEILKLSLKSWSQINKLNDIPILIMTAGKDISCVSQASHLFFNLCNSQNKTLKQFPNLDHDLFVLPEAEIINTYILNYLRTMV